MPLLFFVKKKLNIMFCLLLDKKWKADINLWPKMFWIKWHDGTLFTQVLISAPSLCFWQTSIALTWSFRDKGNRRVTLGGGVGIFHPPLRWFRNGGLPGFWYPLILLLNGMTFEDQMRNLSYKFLQGDEIYPTLAEPRVRSWKVTFSVKST